MGKKTTLPSNSPNKKLIDSQYSIGNLLEKLHLPKKGTRKTYAVNDNEVLTDRNLQISLLFLKLLGVVRISSKGSQYVIKVPNAASKNLIATLIDLLHRKEDLLLQDLPKEQAIFQESILLQRQEREKLPQSEASFVDNTVNIVLIVIKANVETKPTPRYLFQFNQKTLHYQLIGGYKKGGDNRIQDSLKRILKKELSLNKFNFENDVKFRKLTGEKISYGIAKRDGAFSRYNISIYQALFQQENLLLTEDNLWISIEEAMKGVTEKGMPVMAPFKDFKNPLILKEIFEKLPHSLQAQQKQIESKYTTEAEEKMYQELQSLLKQEETDNIEFKSSCRWDYKQNKLNIGLENVILKTIAGFMNLNGGKLIIGVDDDKKVLGIKKDLETLKKRNKDGFMQ